MKKHQHIPTSPGDGGDDEQRYYQLFRFLSKPGPAYCAGQILTTCRQRGTNDLATGWQPKHILWSALGSVAGLLIGISITNAVLPAANTAITQNEGIYSDVWAEMDDGVEQLVSSIASEEEGQ